MICPSYGDRFLLQSPEQRLEEVWTEFEAAHAVSLSRPPSAEQRLAVQQWIQERLPIRGEAGDSPRNLLHGSLHSKAKSLVQLRCSACEQLPHSGKPERRRFFTAIDLPPWSHQSDRATTRALRREIARKDRIALARRTPYLGAVCMSVVAVVPTTGRKRDVDNLVKGLIDLLQGVVYLNDNQIQCLTVRRVEHCGKRFLYYVGAQEVYPWAADVVFDGPEDTVFNAPPLI
jgi:Holliday junction resolvase RusA-like endonuclease